LLTRTYYESQDKPIYVVGAVRNLDEAPVVALPVSARRPQPL
jgi:hypothetical protein